MTNGTFIGIVLAWKSERNPTGAVVLRGDRNSAEIVSIATLRSMDAVLHFRRAHATDHTVLAIDAPLIISNETGQRVCETALGQRYGKNHASCHTSNLRLYKDAASVRLTAGFREDGFEHPTGAGKDYADRIVAEVYPHAAMVALFKLDRIIKYKKGPAAAKRLGLEELRMRLGELCNEKPSLAPTVNLQKLLSTDLLSLKGRALKNYEDILDALFCAYLGYYFWYWGWARNEMFGDVESGYILNPTRQPV